MKNNIGNDSQNEVRAVRKFQRINLSASDGIGTPCSLLSRDHAISFFCTRQTTPQVFMSITRPSPPPMLIARCAFDTVEPPFSTRTSHEAAITTTETPRTRNHGLLRIPFAGS